MSKASQSSVQIEKELNAEVEAELIRRTTSLNVRQKPEPAAPQGDLISPLMAAALLACLALLAGTGIGLSLGYSPSPDDAAASLDWMQRNALGAFTRGLHWHAANLMVALSGAYLFMLALRGLYRRPGQARWWRAGAVLGLVVGFSLTGQFLPYDQNAVHGSAIRLGYLAEAPLIGELLRSLLTGGGELGSAALSRSFAMHVIVLPACTLLLLRGLWGDARLSGGLLGPAGVAGAVVGLCALAAVVFGAPLGLQGDLGEPYPAARPEWFALPLYLIMKFMPPGMLHQLALFAPPLVGGLVLAGLPFADTQQGKPSKLLKLLRIGLLAGAVVFGALAVVPVAEDFSNKQGWFEQPDVESLMATMGKRNLALGHSTSALPHDTHISARDLRLLSWRLRGTYGDELPESDRAKWDEWSAELAGLSDKLLTTTEDAARRKLRAQLRQVCADCHKLHADEEIRLEPRLPTAVSAVPVVPVAPEAPAGAAFLDLIKMSSLAPVPLPERDLGSTKRLMNRAKFRLRDLLRANGQATGTAEGSPEQNFLDLANAVRLFGAMWKDNEYTHADQAQWDKFMAEMHAALDAVKQARAGTSAGAALDAVGKACESCHETGDWAEPMEWWYNDLKR